MPDEVEALTPYQGKQRAFGEFRCDTCKKTWSSANTWANSWQKCNGCNIKIYPHTQRPPLRRKHNKGDPNKKHPRDLCQKCTSLGRLCGQNESIPRDKKKRGRRRRR